MSGAALDEVIQAIDDARLDSLWLSEVLTAPVIDPLVGLAWAAARSSRLKLGTTMLLPGRNLIRLAKELASLDALSAGRLLITFVPGLRTTPERDAIGVAPERRSEAFDEALPLLRRLWAGETVSHHGRLGEFDGVTLGPLPVQQPLEVWFGGMATSALVRCGRLADGWLPSVCTPEEAAAGRRVIDEAAARAGRVISPEHFGVSLGYARQPLGASALASLAARSRGNDPATLVPVGMPALRTAVERFVAAGFSKFVVRPLVQPPAWGEEIAQLGDAVGDLQT